MAAALEEIGDAFAIYGFSGHGRSNVEFYRVKSFAEPLNACAKGRIGEIQPKRSTASVASNEPKGDPFDALRLSHWV